MVESHVRVLFVKKLKSLTLSKVTLNDWKVLLQIY